MADGGEQVSGRREVLMKNCSPCSSKGTDISAVNYCFMCETFFCQDCTEQHNGLLSNHSVTEIESTSVGEALTLQTERCPHHGKALNLYCKEDDTMMCEICISSEHGSCERPVYLPTSVQDVLKDIDVSEVETKLRRTIQQLKSIKINQQSTLTSLQADRDKCMGEINVHHAELQAAFERIVQSSKDQVEQTFERFSVDLQRHQQEVEKCLADLESSEKRLERNQGNNFPLFVELKKCQNQLKTTEEVSTDSLDNLKVRCFSVAVDSRLQILLSELESLVTVLTQVPVHVKKKYQIDVSNKKEHNICSIYGSCVLNEGSILLADFSNQMLKCLNQHSLKVKDQCPMQSFPNDVCIINNSEVAVTQDNQTISIVSVAPRLTPTRTISMNHYCEGVAFSQGELFIADGDKVLYIYNMEGTLLRKVSTDPLGQDIFSRTCNIMLSETADKVYIADLDNGLIILDREGQVQEKLELSNVKIRGTWGLCQDGMGGLFICGYHSTNVVHVSVDGQILTEVLTSSDGLVKPVSVCYDRRNKRLIVTQDDTNQIHVCELESNITLKQFL